MYGEKCKRLMKEIKEDLKKTMVIDWKSQHSKDVNKPQITL